MKSIKLYMRVVKNVQYFSRSGELNLEGQNMIGEKKVHTHAKMSVKEPGWATNQRSDLP